jgi:RimJ/RimL family protein N-acetyltransferase
MFPAAIETERLRLERFDHEHVDPFELYEVTSASENETVWQYVPWEPYETVYEAAEYVDDVVERWEDAETAEYVVRPRQGAADAGAFAGVTLLDLEWDRRSGQIAIWLARRFWGQGYSEERATALLALAFDRLDLEVVEVTHNVENDKSRQAIEKYVERFGGRREGVLRNFVAYGDTVSDEVRYTISHEEWVENRPDDLGVELIDDPAEADDGSTDAGDDLRGSDR